MSDYRRLISYLYSYNNGVKNANVGFAKAERKNGLVRLWINMKGAFEPEESLRVCFFVRRDERVAGIDMGGLEIKGGSGEFKTACSEEKLGVSFDELCGLYIKGGRTDKLFASQWDDSDFNADRIVLLRDILPEKETEDIGQKEAGVENFPPEMVENVAEKIPEDTQEAVEEPPVWERPIREEVYMTAEQLDGASGARDAGENAEAAPEGLRIAEESREQESDNIRAEAMTATENTVPGKEPLPWEELFLDRDMVSAFSDEDISSCVDIAPEDIMKLPKQARALMTNSFVNHGYFNFHHLLLGKKLMEQPDGGVRELLVVGVPGVYNRREKMTANMFGFEKFKFSMRCDIHINHFGYWYREYDEE